MRNNVLYKKNYDPMRQQWLLVVPKQLRRDVLKSLHDAPTSGHLGLPKRMTEYGGSTVGQDYMGAYADMCRIAENVKDENLHLNFHQDNSILLNTLIYHLIKSE
ncbi:hypothetical protein AVEN_213840-1 [Araneus ventricosus]|uniref:Uncharacterized protein n=1 Tax=Araneus ventricosus TaxID=182803 RepID=A0A4Y2K249_ARAVE|nr:hypothetical protein AVEN_213840-1 [Araneus ventricosus]